MRSWLTSIFLLVLLLHSSDLTIEAQNISVTSFKSLPHDLDARVEFVFWSKEIKAPKSKLNNLKFFRQKIKFA